MSREAMEWALETRVGDPTRSLVLVALGKHADRHGAGAWASPETLAELAECSARTVQRHVAVLLEGGLIREGDQSVIPDYIPARRRPIAYDLAMSVETAQEWAAAERGGRRAAAASAGAAAGRKGASRRAEIRQDQSARGVTGDTPRISQSGPVEGPEVDTATPWGVTGDTPPTHDRGDTHDTPPPSGVTGDTPESAQWGDKWGVTWGVTGDTQTKEEPKNKTEGQTLGVTAHADDASGNALFDAPAPPPTPPRRQPKPKKDPDPLVVQANALCSVWWNALPTKPSGRRAFANAAGIVALDLRAGRTEAEVTAALAACGVSVTANSLNYQYEQQTRRRNGSTGLRPVSAGFHDGVALARRLAEQERAEATAITGEAS